MSLGQTFNLQCSSVLQLQLKKVFSLANNKLIFQCARNSALLLLEIIEHDYRNKTFLMEWRSFQRSKFLQMPASLFPSPLSEMSGKKNKVIWVMCRLVLLNTENKKEPGSSLMSDLLSKRNFMLVYIIK